MCIKNNIKFLALFSSLTHPIDSETRKTPAEYKEELLKKQQGSFDYRQFPSPLNPDSIQLSNHLDRILIETDGKLNNKNMQNVIKLITLTYGEINTFCNNHLISDNILNAYNQAYGAAIQLIEPLQETNKEWTRYLEGVLNLLKDEEDENLGVAYIVSSIDDLKSKDLNQKLLKNITESIITAANNTAPNINWQALEQKAIAIIVNKNYTNYYRNPDFFRATKEQIKHDITNRFKNTYYHTDEKLIEIRREGMRGEDHNIIRFIEELQQEADNFSDLDLQDSLKKYIDDVKEWSCYSKTIQDYWKKCEELDDIDDALEATMISIGHGTLKMLTQTIGNHPEYERMLCKGMDLKIFSENVRKEFTTLIRECIDSIAINQFNDSSALCNSFKSFLTTRLKSLNILDTGHVLISGHVLILWYFICSCGDDKERVKKAIKIIECFNQDIKPIAACIKGLADKKEVTEVTEKIKTRANIKTLGYMSRLDNSFEAKIIDAEYEGKGYALKHLFGEKVNSNERGQIEQKFINAMADKKPIQLPTKETNEAKNPFTQSEIPLPTGKPVRRKTRLYTFLVVFFIALFLVIMVFWVPANTALIKPGALAVRKGIDKMVWITSAGFL